MPLIISDEVLKAATEATLTIKAQTTGGFVVDTGVPAPPTPPGPSDEALNADIALALQLVQQPYSTVPSGQYTVNYGQPGVGSFQNARQVAGHIEAIVNDAKYAEMGGRAPSGVKYTGTVEITPFGPNPISLADIVAREK